MTTPKTMILTIRRDGQNLGDHTLTQDVIKIGSLAGSTIVLPDPAVARMHAVIEVCGDEARLIDLGSETGTSINGKRVDKNAPVMDGDVIGIGPYEIKVNPPQTDRVDPTPATDERPKVEQSTIVIRKLRNGIYRVTSDGTAIDGAEAPSAGLALLRLAMFVGLGECITDAQAQGVSETASSILLTMALKAMIAELEEQAKGNATARLRALREVKMLSDADRIPLQEIRTAVLAAMSGVRLVRPLPEADRIAAELDAVARRAGP